MQHETIVSSPVAVDPGARCRECMQQTNSSGPELEVYQSLAHRHVENILDYVSLFSGVFRPVLRVLLR